MQLKDLVKPINEQTDDELMARLREIRHNREVIRPAARKRVERTEAKASRGKVSAIEKLLAGLSPQEQADLLAKLEAQQPGASE